MDGNPLILISFPYNRASMETSRTCNWLARVNTTKANSPPCDSTKPVRTLSERLSPTSGPSATTIPALMATRPTVSAITLGHSVDSSCHTPIVFDQTEVGSKMRPNAAHTNTERKLARLLEGPEGVSLYGWHGPCRDGQQESHACQ